MKNRSERPSRRSAARRCAAPGRVRGRAPGQRRRPRRAGPRGVAARCPPRRRRRGRAGRRGRPRPRQRYGTPLFVIDEADFRSRAAEFATAFGARSVHYAAKAFLCTEVARWVADEGLSLDVCSGGELAVALRAGFPAERIAFHGNNKSTDELVAAVEAGVGYVVVDSLHEIARLDAVARERGATVPVMIRLTVGVEAHTHEFIATAHEDQKFGFSITGGPTSDAAEAARRVLKAGALHAGRAAQPHRQPDLRHRGVRGRRAPRRPVPRAAAPRARPGGARVGAHARPRRRLRHRLPARRRPRRRRRAWPTSCARSSPASAPRPGWPPPAIAVEPGRAIAGPGTVTLYEVGTLKDVPLTGGARRYVSVDGGMSDNIRTALYDAEYDVRLVSRGSGRRDGESVLSRVVGKHCESGDIVVRDCWLPADLAAGRPAGGGRHRGVLLLDGQQLQPAAAPGGGRRARRGARG